MKSFPALCETSVSPVAGSTTQDAEKRAPELRCVDHRVDAVLERGDCGGDCRRRRPRVRRTACRDSDEERG